MARQPTTKPTNGRKTRRVRPAAQPSKEQLAAQKTIDSFREATLKMAGMKAKLEEQLDGLNDINRERHVEIGRLQEKCDRQTLQIKDLRAAVGDLKAQMADLSAERNRLQGYLNAFRDQHGLWPEDPPELPRRTVFGPDGQSSARTYDPNLPTRYSADQVLKPHWFDL